MATEVIIPSLGEVVEDVTILDWFKSEGEPVEEGEPLLEVESEKVTTEIASPASGILDRIFYQKGSKVRITQVVAIIVAKGEAMPESYGEPSPSASARISTISPEQAPMPGEKPDHIRAAPIARKMAQEKGIDLSLVTPTGPHGTIMKKDVEAYLASIQKKGEGQREAERAAITEEMVRAGTEEAVRPATEAISGRIVPLSSMRQTIARRMTESAFGAPHIYLFNELCMDPLIALRESLKSRIEPLLHYPISINDFIVKATALTLREFPYLNARWEGEEIRLLEEINIGLAVALDEGLVAPAILEVDRLGLEEIAQQRIDLVERARQNKLQRIELKRGTFTITSLASFGIIHFTAIINPPQSAILSVGVTQEKLVMRESKVCVKRVAIMGLSVDHRVADGSYGAGFLDSLKAKIENPTFAFLHL
jgi:pyruvate dehydrogenase E2 component (dihydrolipoamide acetyltransferase)